ncbi:hypothetical protein [Colwellia sp. TT2012]|nr:hypothetical protein [Colwellia sp. TT2012]
MVCSAVKSIFKIKMMYLYNIRQGMMPPGGGMGGGMGGMFGR